MMDKQFDVEAADAVIARLTKEQKEALLAAEWRGSGDTILMTVRFTDPWTVPVAEFFTMTHDRLTPLGLAVRERLSRLSTGEG